MKALIQRVQSAQVSVDDETVGAIGTGLLVYVGVEKGDTAAEAEKLAEKVANIRIFEDEQGKMNLPIRDVRGDILVISNFTLAADASKGRRPSFDNATAGEEARTLYEKFTGCLRRLGCHIAEGLFGTHMLISSVADGPVNIIIRISAGGDDGSKGAAE